MDVLWQTLRRTFLLLGSTAVVLAACGGSSTVVATVDGMDISAEHMAAVMGAQGSTLDVGTEQFREELSLNIIRVAVLQKAEREFGITITDEDVDERIANPPPRWQDTFAALADSGQPAAKFETEAQLTIARDRVVSELIRRDPGLIATTLQETPQDLTRACVRHILVPSEVEARAALDRLAAGEDFSTLAAELNQVLDPATAGGFVGACPIGLGNFAPDFAFLAATGDLDRPIGPVRTQFGFHVLQVEQRLGPPTAAEVRENPAQYFPGSTLNGFFTPWFNDAVRAADISVAELVGRWSTTGVGVIPPAQ